ncbi:MAG: M48 family metallopeptidase [Actinomycetota bacterium]|nr:M48 family metallopeptidase [Actinomycetota bacterium]
MTDLRIPAEPIEPDTGATDAGDTGDAADLPVRVVRSARRRRTAEAKIRNGELVVRVPAHLSSDEEEACVAGLVARVRRKVRSDGVDLADRAGALARRHELPRPRSIRWSADQQQRWGSCSVATGDIRVSDRVAAFPPWVLDYVIVHELAHLVVADHSAAFWELVARYPLAERARGFLIAKGLEVDG